MDIVTATYMKGVTQGPLHQGFSESSLNHPHQDYLGACLNYTFLGLTLT